MRITFTDSIRLMIEQGGKPAPKDFTPLWKNLRGGLVRELMKRNLFSSSPSYLGIDGASWHQGEALDELAADCFIYAVLKRLKSLEKHLGMKANIDGLIFLNIGNFVYERQKKHDHVGYRVFKMLQEVTLQSIDAGVLHVLQGNEKIRNDTVLGFSPESEPEKADSVDLGELVEIWAEDLLPELVKSKGSKRQAMQGRLRSYLEGLRDYGAEVFRFKAVIHPLQSEARRRWYPMGFPGPEELALDEVSDEIKRLVHVVRPLSEVEDRDSWHQLRACVDASLKKLETKRKKTKDYLLELWDFLKRWAEEAGEVKPPSNQNLAKQLAIPRDRFPGLYKTLAELAEACQISSRGQRVVISEAGGTSGAAGARAMGEISHQERMRKKMGVALANLAEERAAATSRGAGPPRLGEIYLFIATSELPIEWVVVDQDPADPGYLRVVPIDTHPQVGSADVAVPAWDSYEWGQAGDGSESMSVRCGFSVRLAVEAFDPELCIGCLEAGDLERVRRKRDQIADGCLKPTQEELEVDSDPDYEDWREEVLTKAQLELDKAALVQHSQESGGESEGRVGNAPSDVSRLLNAWSDGDTKALDQLMPLVTDELRRIARRQFSSEPLNHTLQPTAVVNEVYIKLKGQKKVKWHSRAEFFGVASMLIRRILVDYARRRQADKRGGKVCIVPIDEELPLPEERDPELIALDEALKKLATLDQRQSRIVERRIFGGLEFKDIADLEGVSRTTVWRDWRAALPWLRRELLRRELGRTSSDDEPSGPEFSRDGRMTEVFEEQDVRKRA